MKYVNAIILSGADTGDLTGSQIDTSQIFQGSWQIIAADSTAAGTIKIQVSNDLCPEGNLPSSFTVSNWSDLSGASSTLSAGGIALIPKTDLAYRWMRAVFTYSSGGSSTLIVQFFGWSG